MANCRLHQPLAEVPDPVWSVALPLPKEERHSREPISKRSVLRQPNGNFAKGTSALIIFDSGGYFDPCTCRARDCGLNLTLSDLAHARTGHLHSLGVSI